MTDQGPRFERSKFGSITSTSTATYDFEWLFEVDRLFKEDLIAALENELLQQGLTKQTFKDVTSRQKLQDLAEKYAKFCHTDKLHPDEEVEKQLKLMIELDKRLRLYDYALIRARDVSNPGWNHRQSSRSATIDRSISQASRVHSTTSDGIIPSGLANTNTSQPSNITSVKPLKVADDPENPRDLEKTPEWPFGIAFTVLTIVFIIGGMIGLYFEREVPKRVGLVVFLVTLLIILLAVNKSRPRDTFLFAAAYAAVLVVFLSGDLAGPQQVVIVGYAGDGNLVLATSTATSIQVTSISSLSGQLTSTDSLTNPTIVPSVGSTLTTVVVQTTQSPTTQPSSLLTTSTSAAATLGSPTTGFVQGSDNPTSTPQPDASPEYWTNARIAGVVIGVLIGVLIVVGSVAFIARMIRNRV